MEDELNVCVPGSLLSIMWLAWASITFETESCQQTVQQTVLDDSLCSAALPVATLFQCSHMESKSQQHSARPKKSYLKGSDRYPRTAWITLDYAGFICALSMNLTNANPLEVPSGNRLISTLST